MTKMRSSVSMLVIALLTLVLLHVIYVTSPKTTTLPLGTIMLAIFLYSLVILRYKKHNVPVAYKYKYELNYVTAICLILVGNLFRHAAVISLGIKSTGNEERIINELKQQSITQSLFLGAVRAPIIEEICWRGLFFIVCIMITRILLMNVKNHVRDMVGIILFLVCSPVVFALLHLTNQDSFYIIIPYLISAVAFALVFVISKSIIVSMLFHALGNFLSILTNLYDYHITQYNWNENLGAIFDLITIIALAILTINYLRKRRTIKQANIKITNEMNKFIIADTLFKGDWLKLKMNNHINKTKEY